jgi:hypothetical protein
MQEFPAIRMIALRSRSGATKFFRDFVWSVDFEKMETRLFGCVRLYCVCFNISAGFTLAAAGE